MNKKARLLLVDDDHEYLGLFQLQTSGWAETDTRSESLSLFREVETCRGYDAVVVDLHMPGLDGLNLCFKIKQNIGAHFPVFILSQDTDEQSKILGLKLKVDDYLTKDMSWEELELRIRNRIYRGRFEHDGLMVDAEKLEIEIEKVRLPITRVELSILRAVVHSIGRPFTRHELMDQVWNGRHVVAHTLNSHLHNLNGKLKTWRWQIRIDREGLVGLQPNSDFKNESLNRDPSSVGK